MNRLRDMREDADLRLVDVAKKVGMTMAAISLYEKEQRALNDEIIRKFCALFDCSADYLLGLSDVRNPKNESPVSESDTELLVAYHEAPREIRHIVDTALTPYKKEKRPAAAG